MFRIRKIITKNYYSSIEILNLENLGKRSTAVPFFTAFLHFT